LSPEEERADPALAEAIRESLWAARVNRVELDEDGEVVDSPPAERPVGSRSASNTSTSSATPSRAAAPVLSTASAPSPHADFAEEFSLTPREALPITVLARNETTLSLDEIMSCISAEDLRRVAKARKIPPSLLANREAVTEALRGAAKKQTVLGFAPAKGKRKSRERQAQATLPFSPPPSGRITSESLLVAQLLPLIGGHALQLTPELHTLVARVNLIFTRIPPVTASSSSLMLPSILVTSRKRRYPDYGPPTRSTIWQDRPELLTWERAVHWEAVVADALGDTWQEQRKNPAPGFGVRREAPNRVEGARIVKRVWEGVWPVWSELVQGQGAEAVDAKDQQGGLVGDRFKTGQWG
jgi:Fanconi-associated nuclease 1